MRPLSQFLSAVALCATIAQSPALATGITLVGQDRRVLGTAFVGDPIVSDSDAQQFVAPDGGPFDALAAVDVSIEGAIGSASASQVSSVEAHVIAARGTYAASADVNVEGGIGYASCETMVALRFVVPEATTYLLTGYIEAADGGFTSLQFSRPFVTVEWFSTTSQHIELNESGAIDAGTYDLNVSARGLANAEEVPSAQASGGYDLRLIFGTATDAPVVAAKRVGAYPNPFTSQTRLVLPEGARRVHIFDLAGRAVRTLEGSSSVTWDGRDDSGRSLGNGVYWVRIDDVSSEPLQVVRVR